MNYPKNKEVKVLLTENIHHNAISIFNQKGFDQIDIMEGALTETQLLDCIDQYHLVGIRSKTQISEKVLKKAKKMLALGCFCIGTNQVDTVAACKLGIPVFNSPYSNTRSVAELTIATVIMLMRGIIEKNHYLHLGKWLKKATNSYEIRGKILGIIGYGNIGSQVGLIAESLGMEVIFYDIKNKLAYGNALAVRNLKDLLKQADVISLHVPADNSTNNLINEQTINAMKPGSYLINFARGNLVNIPTLLKALDDKHIIAAALDVFPKEPKSNKDEFISQLRDYPQVMLTPHIGGSTIEAQEKIGIEVANFLADYCEFGSTDQAVNFPKIKLSTQINGYRFINIHKNQPGALSAINKKISKMDVNINAQYLNTNEHIGVVVFDLAISEEKSKLLDQELGSLDLSIKNHLIY